jgi:hypothetical protein
MKNPICTLVILLFVILFESCTSNNKQEQYWDIPTKVEIDLKITQITLDTVRVNHENNSGVGSYLLYKDTLVFVDELYSTLYLFDENFNEIDRRFGRGDGPDEVSGRIVGFTVKEGRLFALGPSYDYYILDIGLGEVMQKGSLSFDSESLNNASEVMNNPRPEYMEIYEVDYPGLQIVFLNDEEVLLNITTSHPLFNAFSHREFYDSGRVLAVLDISSGKLSGIYGRMSPIYQSWKFLPYLSSVKLDGNDENGFYLGFEADPLIYYFSAPDELKYAFGKVGKRMKVDYEQVVGTENYVQYYKELRPKYGFFTFIYHLPELNLLFRGYQRGESENEDGLQIYQGEVLIGDVDVPKGFNLIGYRNSKFYGEIKSEDGLSSEEAPILLRFNW